MSHSDLLQHSKLSEPSSSRLIDLLLDQFDSIISCPSLDSYKIPRKEKDKSSPKEGGSIRLVIKRENTKTSMVIICFEP